VFNYCESHDGAWSSPPNQASFVSYQMTRKATAITTASNKMPVGGNRQFNR